ncbi:MAG: hypothetical protein JWM71_807, partial [Solirubrobacteraceae bacterium]|nr:hypothetical protein [Solirubrobacteraceae bacterium]
MSAPAGGGVRALVLDAHSRQALVAVRELGRAGIAVGAADVRPNAPAFASRWCARSAVLPDFATEPDAFTDAVVALCGAWGAEVVIPCHDGAIAALRDRRERFAGVAALALAEEEPLSVAVDKHRTLAVASELGIRVPRGAMVASVQEGERALDELGLPVVVKPSQSWMGPGASLRRQGATLATTRGEALALVADMVSGGTEAAVQA